MMERPGTPRARAARTALLAVWLAVPLQGCFERVVYDTPYFTARVTDAAGRPISGAAVTVWSRHDPSDRAEGTTAPDGTVFVAPRSRQAVLLLPWDTFPPGGKARIEAPGYRPQEVAVSGGIGETQTVRLLPVE